MLPRRNPIVRPICAHLTMSFSPCPPHNIHRFTSTSFFGPLADTHARLQAKVDDLAAHKVTPVTLEQLLRMNPLTEPSARIQNAQFLLDELPIRLARRVKAFEDLPFIVGINPHMKSIYNLYLTSLDRITNFPRISNDSHERSFSTMITDLVSAHSDVIPTISKGFVECHKYLDASDVANFLDKLISARIGVRVLAQHHLALQRPETNYIGIINTKLSPGKAATSVFGYIKDVAALHYGKSPQLEMDGMLDCTVTYIPVHFEYIVSELFKNAIRATIEHHPKSPLPAVRLTISQANNDMTLRIRDQGGGVPYDQLSKIFEYSYSTVPCLTQSNALNHMDCQADIQQSTGGPMAGLGYGLGMARVYSRYFGGSLRIVSMFGHGCDVVLRLPNIDRNASASEVQI